MTADSWPAGVFVKDISSQKMDLSKIKSEVTLCTFGCRSVKSSVYEIQDLCAKSDFVCLQEHWLLPNEVNLLSQISVDFLAAGSSAVDISEDILTGRPYGGRPILRLLPLQAANVKKNNNRRACRYI